MQFFLVLSKNMLENFKKELNKKGDLYLRIKVRPSASKTEVTNILDDGTIKINLAAAPVKGKANIELVKFLSSIFEIKKTNIKIISGKAEKLKLIKLIL